MRQKPLLFLVCMVLLAAIAPLTGCARKSGMVSPKFPAETSMGETGMESEHMESEPMLGEGAMEGFEEGELAIDQSERQAKIARETLFNEASTELQTIYFDFDSSTLKPEAKAKLERGADWLKRNPKVNVQIEGNCDERGTNEYNLALGERRALAARRYLVSLGVGQDRIFTISYGEETPAVEGHDESAWKFNRRDDFKISF
jgi:peptidoglycan-associated lipoprotein